MQQFYVRNKNFNCNKYISHQIKDNNRLKLNVLLNISSSPGIIITFHKILNLNRRRWVGIYFSHTLSKIFTMTNNICIGVFILYDDCLFI